MPSTNANTDFQLLNRKLTLVRNPTQLQHKSLQAWDAADELLIQHVEETLPGYQHKHITIFNDDFGALACWFNQNPLTWVTDSFLAKQACLHNFAENNLSASHLTFVHGIEALTDKPDMVLLKIPKTLALLEYQLICLQKVVSEKTRIVAAGKVKSIHKSTLALFEKHLGSTTTSLAKKKARLIFCSASGNKSSHMPYPTLWRSESPALQIANYANVFSRQSLDIGARFMLEHLPTADKQLIVDLGCGNGILGLSMLQQNIANRVVFADESYMAIASAKQNVEHNFAAASSECHFTVNDCLQGLTDLNLSKQIDLILCNPPFHQQNTITDHIARQMFKEAKAHLKVGGALQIVFNRHLDYAQVLKSLFGGVKVVASNRKFIILSAQKR